ncbi:MAG: hypothetical protein HGA87_02515 [Desulfobulbaceae bacterium]|nr:hypothetical protein [Desulfobulbaceae bacterium]
MAFGALQFGAVRHGAFGAFGQDRFGEVGLIQPQQLFARGEVGAAFDNSRLDTMFQDAAGTTPATLDGPVGLQLELSQGLVLGSERVTNGGPFVNTTGWSPSRGALTVSGGNMRVTANAAYPNVAQTLTTEAGKWYKCTLSVGGTNKSAAPIYMYFGSTAYGSDLGYTVVPYNATKSMYFRAVSTTTYFFVQDATGAYGAGDYFEIASVYVKSIAGNHRYQPTSTKRLTLKQDESGCYYLTQNGVTDAHFITAPIDPTAFDKVTVWAGVRKTSDATRGVVMEGCSILLHTPSVAETTTVGFRSAGTIIQEAAYTSWAAPITGVLVGVGDIANDFVSLSINGVVVASALGDQGTGSYGNSVMSYFMRLAPPSLGFTGREYSSIIRFSTIPSTDKELRDIELWTRNKSKAY